MAEMNPQRLAFKEYYCNPESDTFGNAYQSAVKAGFSEEYAKNIMNQGQEWVSEIIRDTEMKTKAEKVLNEMLDMPVEVQKIEGYGDDKELVVKTEPALIKIKQDTAKFVSETLNKDKYSKRSEMTGKNGEQLVSLAGFNYVKPNNTDNISTTETAPSLGETTGQDN